MRSAQRDLYSLRVTLLGMNETEKRGAGRLFETFIDIIELCNRRGEYGEVRNAGWDVLNALPADSAFLRNRLLNELELAEKKTVLESGVRHLVAILATACNVRCVMCNYPEHRWELPQKTLDEIHALLPMLQEVTWLGGEVFLYPGLKSLVERAASNARLRQVILTNGLLIDEAWAGLMTACNVDLLFSIDGATRDVYEHIRKGASFDTLVKNVRRYKEMKDKAGLPPHLVMQMTVMRSNYRQLAQSVDFAAGLGFTDMIFQPIDGDAWGDEQIFGTHLEPQIERDIVTMLAAAHEKAGRKGLRLDNRLPVRLPGPQDGPAGSGKGMLCHLPWRQLHIHYDGSVRPCCYRKSAVGSIGNASLAEIWNGPAMTEFRRQFAEHGCAQECPASCRQGLINGDYRRTDRTFP